MEYAMLLFFLALAWSIRCGLEKRNNKAISWDKINADSQCLNQRWSLFYEGVPKPKAKEILIELLRRGTLDATDLGMNLTWVALLDTETEDLFETTIHIQCNDLRRDRLSNWSSPVEQIYMRWTIAQDLSTTASITIAAECLSELSIFSKRVISEVIDRADVQLRAYADILQHFNPVSADKEGISENDLLPEVDFWFRSSKANGAVQIPRRIYEKMNSQTSCLALSAFINAGGILKEPVRGHLTLRWSGKAKATAMTSAKLVETVIKFSQYGQEELTQTLAIRWNLQDSTKGGALHVDYEWTGEFQASAGDLVRHLIEVFEHELEKSGAVPVQAYAINARGSSNCAQIYGGEDSEIHVKLFWPSLQDYNETIQNPQLCFSDPELMAGEINLNQLGLPKVSTGAFASVYKIKCQSGDFAVRCFNSQVKDREERYRRTSRFICSDDLTYTVPMHYLEKGIKVRGVWYPILKMEWVDGVSISDYIDEHFDDAKSLTGLRERFQTMMRDLEQAGVAHSDLQHGNIIIKGAEIVLVDYDGMFVPELSGFFSNERGHPNYQHPARDGRHFGPYLDNFSAWTIDTALLCLIHEPQLWHRFANDGESLLFKRRDFENPNNSELLNLLSSHPEDELRQRSSFLLALLEASVEKIPYLSSNQSMTIREQDSQHQEDEAPPAIPRSGSIPDWMN